MAVLRRAWSGHEHAMWWRHTGPRTVLGGVREPDRGAVASSGAREQWQARGVVVAFRAGIGEGDPKDCPGTAAPHRCHHLLHCHCRCRLRRLLLLLRATAAATTVSGRAQLVRASSFRMSGTNAHAVVSEVPELAQRRRGESRSGGGWTGAGEAMRAAAPISQERAGT